MTIVAGEIRLNREVKRMEKKVQTRREKGIQCLTKSTILNKKLKNEKHTRKILPMQMKIAAFLSVLLVQWFQWAPLVQN